LARITKMQSILVTYDLVGTSETSADYERLIGHLKDDYSNWAKVALSTWILRTSQSVVQVRNNVSRYLDADDRLFVAALTGTAAWGNVMCSPNWLQSYL
jgi:hypothetical protein